MANLLMAKFPSSVVTPPVTILLFSFRIMFTYGKGSLVFLSTTFPLMLPEFWAKLKVIAHKKQVIINLSFICLFLIKMIDDCV